MSQTQNIPSPAVAPGGIQSRARRKMVEAAGQLFQRLGLPRSTGQIYGLLYLSHQPLPLDGLSEQLSISKASASTGIRQLSSWGALRQVWVQGDRRDHYQAVGDLSDLLRMGYAEFIKPRLKSSEKRLAMVFDDLEQDAQRGLMSREEYKFCSERMRNLVRFQEKVQSFGPVFEKLF